MYNITAGYSSTKCRSIAVGTVLLYTGTCRGVILYGVYGYVYLSECEYLWSSVHSLILWPRRVRHTGSRVQTTADGLMKERKRTCQMWTSACCPQDVLVTLLTSHVPDSQSSAAAQRHD